MSIIAIAAIFLVILPIIFIHIGSNRKGQSLIQFVSKHWIIAIISFVSFILAIILGITIFNHFSFYF